MELLVKYALEIIYLIGSLTFIFGLKLLGSPETAKKGNLIAAFGMTIAVLGTIFMYKSPEGQEIGNRAWIFGGIILGGIIGTFAAKKVQMTAMPQMVSIFNGMGGGCAAVISLVEIFHYNPENGLMNGHVACIVLGLLIGSISFSGSIIAWGKLEGKVGDKAFPGQSIFNLMLIVGILGLGFYLMTLSAVNPALVWAMFGIALVYGVLFVLPIGGADMPVVISLLNSFTGVAAAFGGFVYDNQVMLTGGILVGSAGTFLTILMCRAMNRSLLNVIIGSFGGSASGGGSGDGVEKSYKTATSTDVGIMLSYAEKVMIVPGYGLAVAQAQHTCHELDKVLEEKGVEVLYAIHPVAGRMPGHMNVLLAEADVPYDKLLEMDQANSEMSTTDVVLILGANDVVNPAAKTDESSPIYGMPILDVLDAKNVVVVKRSMKPGYAGIDNDLFYHEKNSMLFGDAKKVLQDLVNEVKNN